MPTTITAKGQVTLPKKVRDALRLSPGDKLDFFVTDEGHIEAVPIKASSSKLKNFLPPSKVKNISLEDMQQGIVEGASKL